MVVREITSDRWRTHPRGLVNPTHKHPGNREQLLGQRFPVRDTPGIASRPRKGPRDGQDYRFGEGAGLDATKEVRQLIDSLKSITHQTTISESAKLDILKVKRDKYETINDELRIELRVLPSPSRHRNSQLRGVDQE